ncbi:response regulator [Parablautia intestinalis]|jgi:CheY-like chemotaxis protein|uniref:Stage 0 sporulation protein A homolog n=1 Tax=Parablautia intestinalis TaxID=2320100 RepID=A0A3A9AD33_9FIRM|nr:response regulator [Parablautia intestinalis]MCI8616596.1 response regulator [Lachnospiraceae bacterium]MDE7048024.1 response regulator [Lachnospiraceae bacterium]RKI89542.1 response regulator [Parablautia intestinalis]
MRKCILVVDDDVINLKRTKLILDKHYDLILAKSGQEALDKLITEDIDLVLLDIEMPGMNGIETFKRMKEDNIEVPVIFLTASGYEDDVMAAISLGAVNYVKKPFLPKDLLERIAKEFEK